MVKVKLAYGIDRWWNHKPESDPDFFVIVAGEEKETTDETLALSMGRLVRVDGGADDAAKGQE